MEKDWPTNGFKPRYKHDHDETGINIDVQHFYSSRWWSKVDILIAIHSKHQHATCIVTIVYETFMILKLKG